MAASEPAISVDAFYASLEAHEAEHVAQWSAKRQDALAFLQRALANSRPVAIVTVPDPLIIFNLNI